MLEMSLAVIAIIVGCIAFVGFLCLQGHGIRILYKLSSDETPANELEAQVQAEVKSKTLKGIATFALIGFPVAQLFHDHVSVEGFGWIFVAATALIYFQARSSVRKKYQLPAD